MAKRDPFDRSAGLSNSEKNWRHSFGFIAILAFVFGLVSLAVAPIAYAMGMISVIGIPVAIAAVIFPTLCLWVVIAYAVYRVKPQPTFFGVARSFMIAVAIMLVIPQLYNFEVRSALASLLASDKAARVAPLSKGETIAVFNGNRRSTRCYQMCLDLLLSGQISAYAEGILPRGSIRPTSEDKVMLYRLVQGGNCESKFVLPRNKSTNEAIRGTVAYDLKAAMERGSCVQSTEMKLADAGDLRVILRLDRKSLDHRKRSYFINTRITPWRIAVFETSKTSDLSLIMQRTQVQYSLLKPLLAYSISGGMLSSLSSSWWRENVRGDPIKLEDFLVKSMGASLRKD